MALELYFTFAIEALQAEIAAGKYRNLRTFQYEYMRGSTEAYAPQWVISWDNDQVWHWVSNTSAVPFGGPGIWSAHSDFAHFSATCMYFGAELIDAREAQGLEDVPIGLIQSAIGGTMIESWMPNASRAECSDLENTTMLSTLYHGMVAPFANFSVAGWLWYQGENNCHGIMGNVMDNSGYGCALPALINGWRNVWAPASSGPDQRLFGIATLAAGGSEGATQHMAGMRWSQTANFGRWTDNPALPNTFGAQAYGTSVPCAGRRALAHNLRPCIWGSTVCSPLSMNFAWTSFESTMALSLYL
eukprot:m.111533 g.111533  ORF g.111533 m.111533 type:complete len:302 (+) comp12934_c0_seq2:665-1570(+)